MADNVKGKIHSVESFGAVDGPGIRFVVFMQGCPLKCLYCHNPDTWQGGGTEVNSLELVENIGTYLNFIKNGGVTLSGGEPLMQPDFALAVIEGCKELGLHTALDTAGSMPLELSKKVIDSVDLLLLDIKSPDSFMSKTITGSESALDNCLATLEYCREINKPVWIRHVLVSYYTLNDLHLEKLALYLKDFNNVERIELIPFHKMGEFKWDSLNYRYKLKDVPPTSPEQLKRAKKIFKAHGLKC